VRIERALVEAHAERTEACSPSLIALRDVGGWHLRAGIAWHLELEIDAQVRDRLEVPEGKPNPVSLWTERERERSRHPMVTISPNARDYWTLKDMQGVYAMGSLLP
jgi:hypothetical protein